jgi:quercetin dioxygenase-like cupin family protein
VNIQSSVLQYNQEVPWEKAGDGIKRQVFGYDEKVMLVKVQFEKDAVGTLHSHPHTQVTYVESGVFEFTIGDEKKMVKKGDGLYITPNIVHGCVCIEPGLLIDVFSPYREDFIKAPAI